MLSEVGIGPKSLCYGFLNEIVTHPWSEGGPRITRLRCTKFNEGCTKFGISDPIDSGSTISIWIVHNFFYKPITK